MQKTKDTAYQQMNTSIVKKAKLLNEVEIDSSKYIKVSDCVYFARFQGDEQMQSSDLVTVNEMQIN